MKIENNHIFHITSLHKMTLSIETIRISAFNITTLHIMMVSIETKSIICNQYNDTPHNDTQLRDNKDKDIHYNDTRH